MSKKKMILDCKKCGILRSIIVFLMIVFLLTAALLVNVKGLNQRWHFNFDNIGFDLEKSGWEAGYGGVVSVTNEHSRSGNYSLKLTGRYRSWHSPALQLDRIFYEGGPGVYSFTVYVMVNNLDSTCRKYGRSLIRGYEDTSFIWQHDANYFGPIASANLFSGQWTCIQGAVSVTSDDIHRGNFYWMLDCIDAIPGQVIYIDDFDIFKLYDNPDKNSNNKFIINDKPYIKGYQYINRIDGTEEEVCQWYYQQMDGMSAKYQNEMVYTFTRNTTENLKQMLNDVVIKHWWDSEAERVIGEVVSLAKSEVGVLCPIIAPLLDAADVVKNIGNMLPQYKTTLSKFSADLTSIYDAERVTQFNETISISLMRRSQANNSDGFEYKIQSSDGVKIVGLMDETLYSVLVGYCNTFVDNTTYNRPTINKVFYNYCYEIEEDPFLIKP